MRMTSGGGERPNVAFGPPREAAFIELKLKGVDGYYSPSMSGDLPLSTEIGTI